MYIYIYMYIYIVPNICSGLAVGHMVRREVTVLPKPLSGAMLLCSDSPSLCKA